MKIGTKTILFGVHQFVLHPYLVTLAWRRVYGEWPSFLELLAIVFHDVGYIGKADLNGVEGVTHPEFGAKLIGYFFGLEYRDLVLFHSRDTASKYGAGVSKLCLPDKLSITLYPKWLYLLLGRASGEVAVYKREMGLESLSDSVWFDKVVQLTLLWSKKNTPKESKVRLYANFVY